MTLVSEDTWVSLEIVKIAKTQRCQESPRPMLTRETCLGDTQEVSRDTQRSLKDLWRHPGSF